MLSRSRLCPRYVNRRECPTAKQETVIGSAGIRVLPNNLATVVDAVREADRRSRWLDQGETAAAQPKAVINPPAIPVKTHDLSKVVDVCGSGAQSTRHDYW